MTKSCYVDSAFVQFTANSSKTEEWKQYDKFLFSFKLSVFLTYKGFNKYIEIIVTTCKRSLGQGYVFTPVYDSVHGGGEVVCITPRGQTPSR